MSIAIVCYGTVYISTVYLRLTIVNTTVLSTVKKLKDNFLGACLLGLEPGGAG